MVGQPGEVVEVAAGVAQAVGVVDPEPVDEALGEPAADLDVGGGEDVRELDAYAGQGVHREEAAVVELGVGPPPADQLVVLPGMRPRRPAVTVGPSRARSGSAGRGSAARRRPPAGGRSGRRRRARRRRRGRAPDPPVAEVPVDVEGLGVRRLAAVPQHVPPPGVLRRRRDPDVVGHDVDQHAHAEPARLLESAASPWLRPGSRRRGRTRRRRSRACSPAPPRAAGKVDPVDAEVLQVRQGARPRTGRSPRRSGAGTCGVGTGPGRAGLTGFPPLTLGGSEAATEWSGSARAPGARAGRAWSGAPG